MQMLIKVLASQLLEFPDHHPYLIYDPAIECVEKHKIVYGATLMVERIKEKNNVIRFSILSQGRQLLAC